MIFETFEAVKEIRLSKKKLKYPNSLKKVDRFEKIFLSVFDKFRIICR